METFIEGISKQCELKETEITSLRQALRTLHFPKGSTVIGEGKTDDSIYFIQKGVWRAYIERDGEQQTLWFSIPVKLYFLPGVISAGIHPAIPSVHPATALPSR